ncbi:CaiB/BaiF CoA transferase family protein [Streptomyces endophyticus]|uniref:CoA transferase n=1 Tax=Streptomyces endophyticus TaxID=714166 RepID=A0ABU6EZU2_9ACTN|nr:CaiB/BaiF CoA-transferase family protein [Streptomyces endophyticus]MEB8336181.1 CoA transferase [Streptomyces endophyticus]
MTGPLTGVTVVSVEQAVSAPLCTRALGDLGARVIKVEAPGGDFTRYYDDVVHGLAAHFVWVNRGKESLTLDLKSAHGAHVLHRLLDRADVFVSNLAPGAAAKLGISASDLTGRHPDLITMEIDGYGPGGPLSHKRAYDLLVQAEAGACAITGLPGQPAKPGPPMADVCTGLYAALSITALLAERGRGVGSGSPPGPTSVSVSMFDTMTELMGYALTYTRHTGIDQEPVGMGSPAVAPYGAYDTADGHTVVLGTTNDREWQRYARDLLGRPDLADDPGLATTADRVDAREHLDAEIIRWCAARTLHHIQAAADAAGIGNAKLNTPREVLAHPQHAARDRWREIVTPGGPTLAPLPPPVFEGRGEAPMGGVPAPGEHTDAILRELGITGDELTSTMKEREQ